jgi:RNA recognition motif-containing protein
MSGIQAVSEDRRCVRQTRKNKMSNKLFVGGLSWDTNDNSLLAAFSTHGDVTEAKVITDRDTGRSRGFAFVTFKEASQADAAMSALDGTDMDGRTIRVNLAQDKPRGDRRRDRASW